MHPELIKSSIRMSGYTMSKLADEIGVTPSAVSNVITGKLVSQRIRERISNVIGKPVDVIWLPVPSLRRTRAQIEADRARGAAGAAA